MALNQRRLEDAKSASDTNTGGSYLKLKNGKTYIRIFKFKHTATKKDFDAGRYTKKHGIDIGDEQEELERMTLVHFRDGKGVNCLIKDCQYCADADKYSGSEDKADKKRYRELSARKQFALNVVDTSHPENGMQLINLPPSAFNVVLSFIVDPDFGEEVLGCKGRDFIITKDTSALPQDMYDIKIRDQNKSDELDEELENGTVDLFQMSNLEPGWSSDSEMRSSGDSGDDDAPARAPSRPSREKPAAKPKDRGEDNPFQDRESGDPKASTGGDDLPWENNDPAPAARPKPGAKAKPGEEPKDELPDWIEKGCKVGFKNKKGQIEYGIVNAILVDEGKLDVETDDNMWYVKYSEAIKPAKEKPRR